MCLLLAVVTVALYSPVLQHQFVNFDDDVYLQLNPHVRAGLTLDTVRWAFRTNEQANWHPLTWLSHALDCEWFGLNPAGHHFTNLLLHALNVLLLFWWLDGATGARWRSLMVAALFAVHPLNVESVAWAAERKNVLSMLFFLLALAAYGWYARRPGVRRYAAVALFFGLGLMAKPMVITLPFVLLLLDVWPLRRMKGFPAEDAESRDGKSFLALVVEKLPLFAMAAASAVVTMAVQKAGGAMHASINYSLAVRVENAMVAYAHYIAKAFWPTKLAVFYPHSGTLPPVAVLLGASALLAAISGVVVWRRRKRYLAVGWLWFLGTMVPMIGLVQVGMQAMADRYAYLPLVGLFVMTVWGVTDVAAGRAVPARYVTTAAVLIVAVLALDTFIQESYWRNSVTLWSRALAVTERNFPAHDNLGTALIAQGRFDEAHEHFRAAEQINPQEPISQINLAVYDQQHGRLRQAVERLELALRLTGDPTLRENALSNLGSAYRSLGDYPRARASYQAALQLAPNDAASLVGLGLVSHKMGEVGRAAEYYTRAMQVEPSDVGYLLLAQALEQGGRPEEARIAGAQAQRLSRDLDQARRSALQLLTDSALLGR